MAAMAYADLLKALAEDPQGVYAEFFADADVQEAVAAGLVRDRPAAGADVLVLTAAGRRMVGLPPEPRSWLSRMLDTLFRGR